MSRHDEYIRVDDRNGMAALAAIKKQLATPDRWTKGSSARDAEGRSVSVRNPDAKCFCLTGALEAVEVAGMPTRCVREAARALMIVVRIFGYRNIVSFNDCVETNHARVIKLIDDASRISYHIR